MSQITDPNFEQTCTWTEGPPEYSSYSTGCGNLFELLEGGPADNGLIFCGYCGKKIKEIDYDELEHHMKAEGDL